MPTPFSRRTFLQASLGLAGLGAIHAAPQRRKNVLFFVIDDLRPELGCYGNTVVKTPNIDRIAAQGVTFTRAYYQQSVCTPSRTSFLTGLRPDSTKIYDNGKDGGFREVLPDVATLPQWFRDHGYESRAYGKVFGEGFNDPKAWSVPLWPERIAGMQYVDTDKWAAVPAAEKARAPIPTSTWKKLNSSQSPDVPDNALQDGQVADRAVQALREMRGKPFFLAVGFLKPHLPFVAPKKYFDMYSQADIPMPRTPQTPKDTPEVALHDWRELRGYKDIPKKGPLTPGKVRELIHGYYAATTYTDTQIGKVAAELEKLGIASDTTIVLLGDHGWHLGEHDLWAKTTNFEYDTRSPLIVSGAGVRARGRKSAAIVEFVDIFPTLCDVAGLTTPAGLEGTSMTPLLADPQRKWKTAAFSQFPRPFTPSKGGTGMGRSIRTERFRYTEWVVPGEEDAFELYDHEKDPYETLNVANAASYGPVVATLRKALHDGWRAALPPGVTK